MAMLLKSYEARERLLLAPYAMHSADSAGREHPEPPHSYRGPFQRDRDRILHCAAYRRLSAKTQVFTGELGDYHRTRLTHTLEVTSVARTVGRALALNEDLIEALAMVHDLGHPPFGHAGEDLLDDCLKEAGGFSHNAQALRIVRMLETRYPNFPGLNLSREVLEGQSGRAERDGQRLRPLLEAQAVEAADSIAYDTHDADDALELGLLALDELFDTAMWREAARRVRTRGAALGPAELRRAVVHELIDWQVGDLLECAGRRIAETGIDDARAAQEADIMIVASSELAEQKHDLETFLHERVYRHRDVVVHRREAQQMLRTMFSGYMTHDELLPESFRGRAAVEGLARSVGDYLAGMTDRYAQREFARLFAGIPPRD